MPNCTYEFSAQYFWSQGKPSNFTVLQSLKQNASKSARLGNRSNQPSFTWDLESYGLTEDFQVFALWAECIMNIQVSNPVGDGHHEMVYIISYVSLCLIQLVQYSSHNNEYFEM